MKVPAEPVKPPMPATEEPLPQTQGVPQFGIPLPPLDESHWRFVFQRETGHKQFNAGGSLSGAHHGA